MQETHPRHALLGTGLVALLAGAPPAASPERSPASRQEVAPPPALEERVTELVLENGWRFLLLPRKDAPVISFETRVACGGVDEPPGLSGMANLLKNLLFKGSDRIGTRGWEAERQALAEVDAAHAALDEARAGGLLRAIDEAQEAYRAARERAGELLVPEEYGRILEDAGGAGTLNAFTTADDTRFVVSLPSNQVELWCWMEAERFSRPVMREFFAERDALLEARLGTLESSPIGALGAAVLRTAHGAHPYASAGGGEPEEIVRFTRADAEEFFRARYGARRLTTAIVGDIDPETLVPTLRRYFSSIPAGFESPRSPVVGPAQEGERRVEVESPSGPRLMVAWHVPAFGAPDAPAAEIAVRLLGYARSSRLERRLIRADAIASEVTVSPSWGGSRLTTLAMLLAAPAGDVELAALEAAIHEEVDRLAREGPDPEELAGVQRVARADWLRSLRENAAVARGLCEHQTKAGSWRAFFASADRLERVTAKDVQRVLRAYFVEENRTVGTLVPRKEERP